MTQYNPEELGRKAAQHLLDIFIIPELKRRQEGDCPNRSGIF